MLSTLSESTERSLRRWLDFCWLTVSVPSLASPQCALWLALAYDAAGRRDDALDVYRRLENTHPSSVRVLVRSSGCLPRQRSSPLSLPHVFPPATVASRAQKIKKQAFGLRYILEAPELEISPDERVSLPVGVEGADQYACAPPDTSLERNAPPPPQMSFIALSVRRVG